MNKKNRRKGFTMAELLIVVAILVVLAGVAFIAVQRYQRSMTYLEYETIAKEIFIAAQNHLTAAGGQYKELDKSNESYFGINKVGEEVIAANDDRDKIYYISSSNPGNAQEMLDLMLPFGSIDETVRTGGSYIIRYQPSSGSVLDVFYSHPGRSGMLSAAGTTIGTGDCKPLMENRHDRDYLQSYGSERAVVGWYGDADALPIGTSLNTPVVTVYNEKTLWVELKYTSKSTAEKEDNEELVLLITGMTSKAKKAYQILPFGKRNVGNRLTESESTYNIVLDDITNKNTGDKLHFAEIAADVGSFISGENIEIEAVAYNNSALTNVAYSGKIVTNSLFADINTAAGEVLNGTKVDNVNGTAAIANFRHLENLDKTVSAWGLNSVDGTDSEKVAFTSAIQLTNLAKNQKDKSGAAVDLSWTGFIEGKPVYTAAVPGTAVLKTNDGKYYPVTLNGMTYDGRNHSIEGVIADGVTKKSDNSSTSIENVGLFAAATNGSIQNLELLDFTVTGTTSAGALAGTLNSTAVTNVIARNTGTNDDTKTAVNVQATGSAGGLIGIQKGGSINYSAAALIVNGNTAGGLAGTLQDGASVTGCYSAGHTKNGSYSDWTSAAGHSYDVSGATAGGLIGDAGGSGISYSYSTCSVSATARGGGFAAKTTGTITNCYCTGRVLPDFITEGDKQVLVNNAFRTQNAGENGLSATSSGYYFMIINEVQDAATKEIKYKTAGSDAITALDATAGDYNTFVGSASGWKDAKPYDQTVLGKHYDGSYNLKTVIQLAGSNAPTGSDDYYVSVHYGDWPAPEIFIINSNT